jgi:hypothetical protein
MCVGVGARVLRLLFRDMCKGDVLCVLCVQCVLCCVPHTNPPPPVSLSGNGGAVIRALQADTGCSVDIDRQGGVVRVRGTDEGKARVEMGEKHHLCVCVCGCCALCVCV